LVPGTSAIDTVPSLLAGGEFVFSRPAVQSIGPDVLARAHRFASGGLVGGQQPGLEGLSGGRAALDLSDQSRQSLEQWVSGAGKLTEAMNGFTSSTNTLAESLRGFADASRPLAEALAGFPHTVQYEGRHDPVEVRITGADVLGN